MNSSKSEIKITREADVEAIDIVKTEYVLGYKIHLWFSGGKNHVVDFKPFLNSARNPMSVKYRNLEKFRQFSLDYGNLQWRDGEMCFSTEDLYRNDIGVEISSEDRTKLEVVARQLGHSI